MRTILISGGPATGPLLGPLSQRYQMMLMIPQNLAGYRAANIPCEAFDSFDGFGEPLNGEHVWTAAAKMIKRVDWAKARKRLPDNTDVWFMGWIMRQWAQQIAWIECMERVKTKRDIAGMIVHEDVTQQMLGAVRWARANGIPSLHVTHGAYGKPGLTMGMALENQLHADYLSCCGPDQQAFFIEHGADPSHVRVNGMPLYDRWLLVPRDRVAARVQLHVPQDKPVIGYIGAWASDWTGKGPGQHFEAVLRAVYALCKARDWGFVAKIHPAGEQNKTQDCAWATKIAQEMGVHGAITAVNNEVCMAAVDCWVACGESSFCVEAAICEVPCAAVEEVLPVQDGWPTVIRVGDIPAVVDAMLTAEWRELRQEARQKYVYSRNYLSDGRATERVCKWVAEIMPWQQEKAAGL